MTRSQLANSRVTKTVIAEAKNLMEKCGFTELRGDYREGKYIAILVDPRLEEPGCFLSSQVTCRGFGHVKVNWSGLVIVLKEENRPNSPFAFAFLNPPGIARFSGLPLQGYRLSLEPYQGELWTAVAHIPPAEQIEQQAWLEPEVLCRELSARASGMSSQNPELHNDAFETILSFAGRQESRLARPALQSCLGILCDPGSPASMRTSASHVLTQESAFLLSEIDLAPYLSNLSEPQTALGFIYNKPDLDEKLFGVFGTILSVRPSLGRGEKDLISALIARSRSFELNTQEQEMRIRGAIPTRGAVRTRGPAKGLESKNPLIALARAGGTRVRNTLVDILKKDERNSGLMTLLKNLKS